MILEWVVHAPAGTQQIQNFWIPASLAAKRSPGFVEAGNDA